MSEEIEVHAAKIGEGHLAAMGRVGLKELSQTLVAFPESNIRPIDEPGAFGCPTQQIVTAEMGAGNSYHDMLEQYASRDNGSRDSLETER